MLPRVERGTPIDGIQARFSKCGGRIQELVAQHLGERQLRMGRGRLDIGNFHYTAGIKLAAPKVPAQGPPPDARWRGRDECEVNRFPRGDDIRDLE